MLTTLVVAGAGAVGTGPPDRSDTAPPAAAPVRVATPTLQELRPRAPAVSRGRAREPLAAAVDRGQEQAAERRAEQRPRARAAERAWEGSAKRPTGWVLPVSSYRITATFGEVGPSWSSTHTGLDFAAAEGSAVAAVAAGVVTRAWYDEAYGNTVVVKLPDGTQMWYSHLSGFAVGSGEAVRAGQVLGHVGMTGNATGPHLHLEVRPSPDVPVDPYPALAAHGAAP